jgi:hypothetical protein
MAEVGDGVRDANRRRNERQAAANRRKRELARVEQRELEEARLLQARLKAEFLERQSRRAA